MSWLLSLYLHIKLSCFKELFNSLSGIHITVTNKITALRRNKFRLLLCHKSSNLVYIELHNVQLGTFLLSD